MADIPRAKGKMHLLCYIFSFLRSNTAPSTTVKMQKKCDSLLNVGRPMRCLKELIEFTKQALTTRTMYEVWANIGKFLFSSLCTSYDFNGEIKFTVNVRG